MWLEQMYKQHTPIFHRFVVMAMNRLILLNNDGFRSIFNLFADIDSHFISDEMAHIFACMMKYIHKCMNVRMIYLSDVLYCIIDMHEIT